MKNIIIYQYGTFVEFDIRFWNEGHKPLIRKKCNIYVLCEGLWIDFSSIQCQEQCCIKITFLVESTHKEDVLAVYVMERVLRKITKKNCNWMWPYGKQYKSTRLLVFCILNIAIWNPCYSICFQSILNKI